MKNKRIMIILAIISVLLLIPLVAMQFSSEVQWSGFDFAVMGALLLITGFAIEVVLRMVTKQPSRTIFCIVVFGVFLLIWAELAVGVFGTPFAGS